MNDAYRGEDFLIDLSTPGLGGQVPSRYPCRQCDLATSRYFARDNVPTHGHVCEGCYGALDDGTKAHMVRLDEFMVLPKGGVFVKTREYFEHQLGHREDWGKNWLPILAESIEDARAKGVRFLQNRGKP